MPERAFMFLRLVLPTIDEPVLVSRFEVFLKASQYFPYLCETSLKTFDSALEQGLFSKYFLFAPEKVEQLSWVSVQFK